MRDKDVYDIRSYEYIHFQSLKKDFNPKFGESYIGNVLKKFKNNKSPGINGISAEFVKVLWKN